MIIFPIETPKPGGEVMVLPKNTLNVDKLINLY